MMRMGQQAINNTTMSDASNVSNMNMSDATPAMSASATIDEYISIYLVFASISSIDTVTV
eukprot:CAMPEP_0168172648 /NCGR_PEP_ID=MMETSP0139_2-20121125/5394_1 /TAXON_ID=44445 /ORGANISM="Pseudo-nitzschia australis, Strain 10249 10 AB" /LENGTH=59 /DNA_ID=CAMNT_0008090369 /DNA_START=431 /DNA_END=610 /DNA_ORIENTATION=-